MLVVLQKQIKFLLKVGERKDKELMDSGLLSNDKFFGQEVAEKY
jgi:hypothetical protein